ncbi:ABC transporter substrate-binding protein [Oerskovia turbata]
MRRLPVLTALTAVAATLALTACTDASSGSGSTATGDTPSVESFDPSTIAKDDAIAAMLPADVVEAGTLKVGTNATYAPAEFIADDGKTIVGYDVDLAKAIGAVLGLDVEVETADFAAIIPAIGSKYDIGVSGFTITPERLSEVDMISYFRAGESFAVAKGNPKDVDPSDVCGLSIAVQTGTVEDEALDGLMADCEAAGKPDITPLRYTSQADVTTNLVGGKADVMYADSQVVAYAVAQTGGQIETIGDIFADSLHGIAIAKSDTALTQAVQAAVQKLMDDSDYTAILDAWGNTSGAVTTAELNPAVS